MKLWCGGNEMKGMWGCSFNLNFVVGVEDWLWDGQ